MSNAFHSLTIAELRREIADAVSISLTVPPPLASQFRFAPGQHLTLRAQIGGEDVRRNYSICSAPHEGELRVAIKAVPGGLFSGWANRDLAAGQQIEVMPPHGSFTWPFDPARKAHYLGFAGGSGITPVLSLLKTALTCEPESRFTLLYGNRSTASIMFLEDLAALKNRFLARLQIVHVLEDEEGDFDLLNGRLDADKIGTIVQSLVDPASIEAAFVCGPAGMMDAADQALQQAGVERRRILIERFTVGPLDGAQQAAARTLESKAQGRTMLVTVDGRRRKLTFEAGKGSILEAARDAGLPAPFACKAGVCATCRAKVVRGEVSMKQNFGLSAEEVAQGFVLSCQAVPLSDDVELTFDV